MDEKNVLLLSLSKFTGNGNKNNYYYGKSITGNNVFIKGKYQLEPGTKYIISELANQGRCIDKVIMLCTPETLEPKDLFDDNIRIKPVEYYEKKFMECVNQEQMILKIGQATIDDITSIVKTYEIKQKDSADSQKETFENLEGAINKELIKKGLIKKKDSEYVEIRELYSKANENMFEIVEIETGREYQAVSNAVKLVKGFNSKDTKVNLFVDLQGGMRTTMFVANAVLNMLRHEGIMTERQVATLFSADNVVNEIRDETESIRIFDLVSAIDEFFSYGKGKKFCEYYEHYAHFDETKGDDSPEKKIVNMIREMSDVIELSDIDGLEESIGNLISEIKKIDEKDKTIEPIFRTFMHDLKAEYEYLLEADGKTVDTIKIVEWCNKKELYQQALTLIEARIPEAMAKDRILYYCKKGNEKQYKKILVGYAAMCSGGRISGIKKNKDPKRDNFAVWNVSHFFLKNWIGGSGKPEKYMKLLNGEDIKNIEGIEYPIPFEVSTDVEDKEKLKQLIEIYYKLADLRNKRNHAVEKKEACKNEDVKCEVTPPETVNIKETVEEFIKLYYELRDKINSKSRLISWAEVREMDISYTAWKNFVTEVIDRKLGIKKLKVDFDIILSDLKKTYEENDKEKYKNLIERLGEREVKDFEAFGKLKSVQLDNSVKSGELKTVYNELLELNAANLEWIKANINIVYYEVRENSKRIGEICS